MRSLVTALFLGAALATPLADVWDVQTENDNTAATDNELLHGTTQLHDLGSLVGPTADLDWYLMPQPPRTSWEVLVDGTSGDFGPTGPTVERIAGDGMTVQQSSVPAVPGGAGYSRALRWQNATTSTVFPAFIRVTSASCGTSCGADDVYAIRARESTIAVARFNNSGTQVTVLLTQNVAPSTVNATAFFFNAAGAQLATQSMTIAANALNVLPLSTVGGLAGQSGSLLITHDGGYGSLNVKSVALEPATGFSFDTPGVVKPY
jgi:hypothetical protein